MTTLLKINKMDNYYNPQLSHAVFEETHQEIV